MANPESNPNFTADERQGTDDHAASLMPAVYAELRRVAASMLKREGPLTIQPTALVHEAFMRLAGDRSSGQAEESQFRALAALAMRRILVDHVRQRRAQKRGSGRRAVSIDVSLIAAQGSCDAGALDEALSVLEAEHPRIASLVIYRFFGGLSVDAAAQRLGVSVSTAETDWRFARAWLKRRMSESAA
jgi:RNA polymerase sigma-70 factor, ECF subfamily